MLIPGIETSTLGDSGEMPDNSLFELEDEPSQNFVCRCLGYRTVEFFVQLDDSSAISSNGCRPTSFQNRLEGIQRVGSNTCRGQRCGFRLEEAPDLKEIVHFLATGNPHECTLAVPQYDPAIALESMQRLPDRVSADPEFLGELRFRQVSSGRNVPMDDLLL